MVHRDLSFFLYIITPFPLLQERLLAKRPHLCYPIYKKGGMVMHLQESGEMYLETIYVLSKVNPTVRSIDVAEHMGYSKPSVSRAMGILKQGGYVTADADGFLTLTEEGLKAAKDIFERHTVLTRFLTSLGVSAEVAAEDACKIEHVISQESFDALKAQLK
jgi:Mn-dependent DtxR family transcriptional regulator